MAKDTQYSDWPFPNERFLTPYTETIKGDFAIDENDVGMPNVRLRSTRPRRFLTLGFNIPIPQWNTFEQWRKYTILQGALPFNIPDPNNFQPDDPSTWLTVRFAIDQMDSSCWQSMEYSVLSGYTMTTVLEVFES